MDDEIQKLAGEQAREISDYIFLDSKRYDSNIGSE